ncbi:MAG TPA: FtsW/RodA/SpoVE family cell cycle protein, partial [Candidatus Faecivivens stercoravium]|nr:FtsW/RodA/SpoVE family cell cycle protein [Candidatus Faecivivens stercoravium]
QPSELLKFGLIVTFAALIARNYRQMDTFKKGILEFFYFLIPAFGVVALQRHMSWIMLMVIICGGMMFIAGSKIYYILLLVPVGLLGLVILQALGFDYIGSRIDAWLDPFSDIQNGTWQIVQSLYAIGSGGLFGVGLGNSTQKFLWISEPQNDFIFAVVCEELGLVGALMIILLFVLFVASGFSIAMRAPDKFGSMLVIGIVLQFGTQALLNIAVVSNAMPTTGISLPFFSAGGSATLVQLAQVGIVLNVSRYCRPAISRKKDAEGASSSGGEQKPKIKIISSREI